MAVRPFFGALNVRNGWKADLNATERLKSHVSKPHAKQNEDGPERNGGPPFFQQELEAKPQKGATEREPAQDNAGFLGHAQQAALCGSHSANN